MVTKARRQCHHLLDGLDYLSETRKIGYTYCQTKTVIMTLKVDQGRKRRHNSVGHIV